LVFPETIQAGLRVAKLGRSSVRYEVGLFSQAGTPAAEGSFVHVFVDRATRTSVPVGGALRAALERLLVASPA
jgi:acyl-CoA thioester hydrolase